MLNAIVLVLAMVWAVVNAIAFFLMARDKQLARRQRRRIPEKVLLGWAFWGGAAGATAAMVLFRHKTRHWRFRYGLPLMLVFQLFVVVFCLIRLGFFGSIFL